MKNKKNGYFTMGNMKCDECSKKPIHAYGNRPGITMYGTYHYKGKELCRECAKKNRVI